MATPYSGWEYPPPGEYSTECRDDEGVLRVSGRLLKKGGSRRSSQTQMLEALQYRRNWNERWFFMDLADSTLRYYVDPEMRYLAGEVRFLPGRTKVLVPRDVKLTGKHAPKDGSPVDYMELVGTSDATGKERTVPFALRANTLTEFNEWQRTFSYVCKSQGVAGVVVVQEEAPLDDGKQTVRAGSLGFDEEDASGDDDLQDAAFRDMEFYYQTRQSPPVGPVRLDGLRDAWRDEAIDATTYVYSDSLGTWLTIDDLPGLARLLLPPTSPPSVAVLTL